ncbi:hypothetical protein ACTMU2_36230, partial [Cupriavidus basilensis]
TFWPHPRWMSHYLVDEDRLDDEVSGCPVRARRGSGRAGRAETRPAARPAEEMGAFLDVRDDPRRRGAVARPRR